jgi:hypothetical protein
MKNKIDPRLKKFLKKWKPVDNETTFTPEWNKEMEKDLVRLINTYTERDPKYLGIPNICFSLTEPNDKREETFRKQRLKNGFDDSETWSLRDTIANFILPRLKRHREIIDGVIKNNGDLYEDIDKSIRAFELVSRDDGSLILNEQEEKEYYEGMEAFQRVFLRLWW